MIKLAERLSKDFVYVRVDFYLLDDGTIKFGEMTFTPSSGVSQWSPPSTAIKFAKMIRLPKRKIR
jgi:hypothetical protein